MSNRKPAPASKESHSALSVFHPAVQQWFGDSFDEPTLAQRQAWPSISSGENTLLLAPTGSGKTLAAFLVAINRLMFGKRRLPDPAKKSPPPGVSTLYISPLKALGVDVERNLRAPVAGVRVFAEREGLDYHLPTIGVRSGDTTASERQRMTKQPPDILITTPESLYLLLTSKAREILLDVETVIIDEIHSLVRGKRGPHLFLSLERLEHLRRLHSPDLRPMQRVGLSATQRPLDEVARLLGGGIATADPNKSPQPRPVKILEAGSSKQLDLTIEVPVEDMARLAEPVEQSGPASSGPTIPSIWPSIHPRLVELVKQHRSTMIFVNSRRLAERLASAINDLAEDEIALAHHGSIARDTRLMIEDRLKRGDLPAIVATSSLELGIDMGAVDLVIQIEAPPSIASGLQRIGRAGHQVGAPSTGVIIPKFRGDLLASSAAADRMVRGEVEETFYPRNPLDVLAQQIVAMVSLEPMSVDDLYSISRSSAPFFDLPYNAFENTLDLLAGRYPSDEFAELRPRVTWDRIAGMVSPRRGTQRVAIANAGTIPDRGLYGVFLADGETDSSRRVGELDEEMVFETRPGDVFLLGASAWRAVEITHDRVLVVPAPGEPGRMPFWRGDGPGRPVEFGRAIGKLTRELVRMDRAEAESILIHNHSLDQRAANNLLQYLHEQAEATEEPPSDTTVVIESFLDEVGDWRVVVMTPFGGRVHAPWAMASATLLRRETDGEVDLMWSDDGMVFRLPETDEPPDQQWFLPSSEEIEEVVTRELGTTALFASHFRENAGRALLLPKRQPGRRTPLWLQRRRSADLLKVAAKFERFPILLETYRECLRDVFDIQGLKSLLKGIESRSIRVKNIRSSTPSPFASSLLFNYTANFLYDGDAPLAERRAATLALDHAQLRELLGDAELRELLDAETVEQVALELQRLDGRYPVKHVDGVHDLLLKLGDLSHVEISQRCGEASSATSSTELEHWLQTLESQRRIVPIRIAGDVRFIAAEDTARYRDALGIMPPQGLPEAFLESPAEPLADLVSRYARTHAPFKSADIAARYGIGIAPIESTLRQLAASNRVLEGEFLPGGCGREWCDEDVLRRLKRRSLAQLRKEIEPVEPSALCRFMIHWQGIQRPRRGLDGLLDVIEQLQGASIPASVLEREVLPARVQDYQSGQLDELCAAGEIMWRGIESIGTNDGRIALYLTDHAEILAPIPLEHEDALLAKIVDLLRDKGALFFDAIHRSLNDFPNDVLDALWRAVWAGYVTNDTLAPVRSLVRNPSQKKSGRRRSRAGFRSRREQRLPGSDGRWSLFLPGGITSTHTERQTALATQLIERNGIVTREFVANDSIAGGFSGLYPVFKALEETGRVRRGYFIAGQGAAQFAAPGAEDRLRDRRGGEAEGDALILAATDPANPYGAALRWPTTPDDQPRPQRTAGARVVLYHGELIGFISRSGKSLQTFLPETEPERSHAIRALIEALKCDAKDYTPVHLEKIDGQTAESAPITDSFLQAGFIGQARGVIYKQPAA